MRKSTVRRPGRVWMSLLLLVLFTRCGSHKVSGMLTHIQEVTQVNLPADIKTVKEFDNGEWMSIGKYQLPKTEIEKFITDNPFINMDGNFWWLTHDKKLDSANRIVTDGSYYNLKYFIGCGPGNNWMYTINDSTGELWVEIQYRDHEGVTAGCYSTTAGPYKVDTSQYAIIPYDPSARNYIFSDEKNLRPAPLTAAEVDSMEQYLVRRLDTLQKRAPRGVFVDDLSKYKRQYVAYYNKKGQKEVWINFFCDTFNHEWWRRGIVAVDDGGSCYFNLKINLETHVVYDIAVNGVA